MTLPRAFFDRHATELAGELLGAVIRHDTDAGTVAVRLTEVEAYEGERDPASHAYRGRTARNAVMFGEPGHVYVYFVYGMHFCMNLVCLGPGVASAVLLRAGEVIEGVEVARARCGGRRRPDRELARGPARLTRALGIDRGRNGTDACDPSSALRVEAGAPQAAAVLRGPRTGVAAAMDDALRFYLDGEPTVSPYRRHKARDRRRDASVERA